MFAAVVPSPLAKPSFPNKSNHLQFLCQRRFALTPELGKTAGRGLAKEAWMWCIPTEEFLSQCARSGLSRFAAQTPIVFKQSEGFGDNCQIVVVLDGKLSVSTQSVTTQSPQKETEQTKDIYYFSASECVRVTRNRVFFSETETVLLGITFSQQLSARLQDIEDKWIDLLGRDPLLSTWNKQQIKELFENSKMRSLRQGEVLFEEGENTEQLYFILRGTFTALKPAQIEETTKQIKKDNMKNTQIRSLLNLSSNKVQNISREQISPFIICRTEDSEQDHRLCSNNSCRNRMSPNVMKAMESKRITQKDQFKQSQKKIESKRSQDNLILSLEDISEFSDSERKKEEDESENCSVRDQSDKGCDSEDSRFKQKQSPSLLPFSLQPISNELQRKQENVLLLSPKQEIQVLNFGEGEAIGDERILCQCSNTVRYKIKCTSIEGGQLLQVSRSIIEFHKTPSESDTKNLQALKLFQQKKLARYNKESFPKGIPNSPQFILQKNCLPMLKVLGPSEISEKVSTIKRSPSLSQQYSKSETNLKCFSDDHKKQVQFEISQSPILMKCCKAQFHPVGEKLKEAQAHIENVNLSNKQEQKIIQQDLKDNNQKPDEQSSNIKEQESVLKQAQTQNKETNDVKEESIPKPSFFKEQKKDKINISAKQDEKYPNQIKHPLLKSPLQIHHQFSPLSMHYPSHHNATQDCISQSQTTHSSIKSYLNSHNFFNQNIQNSSKSMNDIIKCKSFDNINSKSLNQQQVQHKSLLTNDLRISLNLKSSGEQHLLSETSSKNIQQRSCSKQSIDSKTEFNFNENLSSNTKRNEWKQLFSPGYRSHPEFTLHEVSEVHHPVSVCLTSTDKKYNTIPQNRRYSDQEGQKQHNQSDNNSDAAIKCKKILAFQDNNNTQGQDSRQQIVSRVRSLGWINMEEMIENNEHKEKCVSMQETGNPQSVFEHARTNHLQNEKDCYNYRSDNTFPKSAKSCEKDIKYTKDNREIKSSSDNKSLKMHFNWNQTEIQNSDFKEPKDSNHNINEDKFNKMISPELKAKCLYLCGNNQDQETSSSSSNYVSLGVIQSSPIPKIAQHSQQLTLKDLQEQNQQLVPMVKPSTDQTSSGKITKDITKTTNPINRIFKQSVS